MTSVAVIREFNIPRRRRPRKRPLKTEFAFFQSLSWLFQLAYFVKCKRTILEFRKRKKIWSLLVYVLHKTWIRYFQLVVLQWRQRNVQDRVINANTELLLCLFNPLLLLTFSLPLPSPSPSPSPSWHLKLPITAVVNDAYFIKPLLCFKMEGLNFNFSLLLYRVFRVCLQINCLVFIHNSPRIFKWGLVVFWTGTRRFWTGTLDFFTRWASGLTITVFNKITE